MSKAYQATPFRIQLNPYGSFEAIASTGIIKARTQKAKRSAESEVARADVEALATFHLKRKDWKWET